MASFMILPFLLLLFLPALLLLRRRRSSGTVAPLRRRPPGPRPLPIVGNLLQLGSHPHRSLAVLSKTYGPVMSLRLGTHTATVISSATAARVVLQALDHVTANRVVPDSSRALDHHAASVAWLPASSALWRRIRRAMNAGMFSARQLEAGEGLRAGKVREMVGHVEGVCARGGVLDVGATAFTTLLNLTSCSLFSAEFGGYGTAASRRHEEAVIAAVECLGRPNVGDFFPVLRGLDLQGVRRGAEECLGKLMGMIDGIMEERMEARRNPAGRRNDLLEALLDANQRREEASDSLSIDEIRHLLLDLFIAGTDTTRTAVEWAMAHLLREPEKLARAQSEIRRAVGTDAGRIQEADLGRFPYLAAVFKETLRLHPPGPVLVRRTSGVDVEVCGFHVPGGSRIMVNAWAIGRDEGEWREAEAFEPERFLGGGGADYRGRDLEFIPFGAGRRLCPGMPVAQRMGCLMVAALVGGFDWKAEREEIDMEDRHAISVQRARPLKAIPVKA